MLQSAVTGPTGEAQQKGPFLEVLILIGSDNPIAASRLP